MSDEHMADATALERLRAAIGYLAGLPLSTAAENDALSVVLDGARRALAIEERVAAVRPSALPESCHHYEAAAYQGVGASCPSCLATAFRQRDEETAARGGLRTATVASTAPVCGAVECGDCGRCNPSIRRPCDCGRPPLKHLYDPRICPVDPEAEEPAPVMTTDERGQFVCGPPPDGRSIAEHLAELVADGAEGMMRSSRAADAQRYAVVAARLAAVEASTGGPAAVAVGECAHEDFDSSAEINRFLDTGSFTVDLRVTCKQCGEAFRFLGLPPAISTQRPCLNIDGTCATLPIEPEGQKRMARRMSVEMPKLPGRA